MHGRWGGLLVPCCVLWGLGCSDGATSDGDAGAARAVDASTGAHVVSGPSAGRDASGGAPLDVEDAGVDAATAIDAGAVLDVPGGRADAGGVLEEGPGQIIRGCRKVDFLFVIDGSGSMVEHQMELAAAFPEFIRQIEDELQVSDFHIMVVDVDAYAQDCADSCFGSVQRCNGAACAGLPAMGSCEATLGGGRVSDLEGDRCPVVGHQPYLTAAQTNLSDTFSCIARVGGGQIDEQTMAALVAAISPELQAPGACNEGFLRQDAILVIVIMSDEVDVTSPGTPADWYQAVVDAKGGDTSAIAVLGITPGDPGVREFAGMFSHARTEWITNTDYSQLLTDAVGDIVGSCHEFQFVQ